MKKPSILIIDDETNNFDVIETFLRKQDYQLHYASSGKVAISSLDTFQPDVILLDVMMPVVDGLEVCRQIKAMAKWKAVPIIMVTALNSKKDLARCLENGADDFISKPINSNELRARLHSMLRIKQQHDNMQSFVKLQRNTISLLNHTLKDLRGNLASTFSHELNTPVHGVLASLDWLMMCLEDMSIEQIRKALNLSYQSALRLEKRTQKALNYLSLELELDQPDQPNTSNAVLITDMAADQAHKANRLDDLACHVEAVELAISPIFLQWIIDELIDNAFKFSQPGMPVAIQGQPSGGSFHIKIHDHGHGMTNEQIKKIGAFMQFERTTHEQQGLGLGLAIAKKTVELCGGRFQISSIYQQETMVQITLPLVNA